MSELNKDDHKYTVEELITDESFIRWVQLSLPEDEEKWGRILNQSPELNRRFAEARLWIEQLAFTEHTPSLDEEVRFSAKMKQSLGHGSANESLVRRLIPNWLKVAAVLSGVLITALGAYWGYEYFSFKHLSTGYGELTKIILPDSSEVTLNANSKVRYARSWDKDQIRELWLDGEAYFQVKHLNKDQKHIKNSERFVVHTPDMNIQVLGTSFNVKTRRNTTKVVLTTGKVMLTFNDRNKASLIMKPGDLISYSKKKDQVVKQTVNPIHASSWKQHQLTFEKNNIKEIAETIEDNFGYTVKVNIKSLEGRTISGSVSSENIDDLIKVLSDLLNVEIKKDPGNKTIIIQEKN
ncbi:FecR domain-containing protein [Solitalea sp. MAHUQ-68]|uniref:FecR domain-containing protein n=1 Tax=Solitalea agri TaxID=2953739 RepID=A0A9X2JE50_9SPHI|nr:FecR domain-containing protein [Solitalea agri]MCO4293575.1 FecR domain-containing protein [Solitalea agri]